MATLKKTYRVPICDDARHVTDADDTDNDRRFVGDHVMGCALLRHKLDGAVDSDAKGVSQKEIALLNEDAGQGRKFA